MLHRCYLSSLLTSWSKGKGTATSGLNFGLWGWGWGESSGPPLRECPQGRGTSTAAGTREPVTVINPCHFPPWEAEGAGAKSRSAVTSGAGGAGGFSVVELSSVLLLWYSILGLSSRRLRSSDVLWGQNSLWLVSPDFLTSAQFPRTLRKRNQRLSQGTWGLFSRAGPAHSTRPGWRPD